jgi:hypothetical protein
LSKQAISKAELGLMNKLLVLLLVSACVLSSCRSTKKIQTVISNTDTSTVVKITDPAIDSAKVKEDIMQKVNSNRIDFDYFMGKIKLDIVDQKDKSTNATAFVRMKKDSLIWVSVTGALGIEGYRVLVKPDTVMIMDKLEKTIAYKSVSYLQELIKLPIDFYNLQDLLLGNPVFFPDNIVSYRTSGNTLLALSIGDFFKHLITIDTTRNLVLHSKLDEVKETSSRTCDITLNGYNNQQGRMFSNEREITVAEKAKLDIKMEYKQVLFDERQDFPFNIPKTYKVK